MTFRDDRPAGARRAFRLPTGGRRLDAHLDDELRCECALVRAGAAVFAALLTPQGKWLSDFLILAEGMVPYIPFVEGEVHLLLAVLLALDGVADGNDGMNEIIQIHAAGEEAGSIGGGVGIVAV